MADNNNKQTPSPQTKDQNAFKKKRGFSFFGRQIDADGIVKIFFGGNAYLAILSLIFICLFLVRASMGFLPGYRVNIEESRRSGIEFVDLIRDEVVGLTTLKRKVDIAYIAEKRSLFEKEEALILLYNRFEALLDDTLDGPIDDYLDLDEGTEKEAAATALKALIDQTCRQLSEKEVTLALSPLGIQTPSAEALTEAISYAQQYALDDYETPEEIATIQKSVRDGMGAFQKARVLTQNTGKDLVSLEARLAKIAEETSARLVRQREIPGRIASMKEGVPKTKDPAERAEKLATARKLSQSLEESVPVDEIATTYYESLPQHQTAVTSLITQLKEVEVALPKEFQSPKAQATIDEFRTLLPGYFGVLDQKKSALSTWRHDREVTIVSAIKNFFFGSEWQTNSSWQNIYGLLPLLSGSVLISVIALCFAVPLAVGAAIYVNQFARPGEAGFLKPAIEFVQAIPSVVLGLFGVLVLAGLMKDISTHPFLSWLPGFPIQDRLNALLAGLLLAFMAAPTIFTLAEDALNNVPKAYSEASLAMGATKLQTAIKVVVPAALSGILAAVMLGFGRVIGETMVVLLVAGNKATIPDLTQGFGVVTEPVHTMTSIIAQECGEVEQGSVHYMALFMVGLILFVISLVINSLCQRTLNKKP